MSEGLSSPRPELLAPAGGMDSALAAFHFGADAIYLGMRRFSARAEAQNFSPEELESVTAYAHSLPGRKSVYVAINTLFLQRELPEVIRSFGIAADCGVDGVILQDLAAARLIRRNFPELPLHGSTQMAVHSREGVETLRRLGFKRVVLSRELTLEEIAGAARVPGIEVEVFLHGALCYAVSGLCLFSSLLFGKSGNRGACAYPCRDIWRITGGDADSSLSEGTAGRCFSMKDLALERLVAQLAKAGVASLKIEGRKKSPLYVAAAVSHYRHLLDGNLQGAEDRASALRTIFSRPWTELFLRGSRNPLTIDTSFAGHRGEYVGRVDSVIKSGRSGAAAIRFTPNRPLERHDGLQIEIPGEERPFGFAVSELRSAYAKNGGRSQISVPAFKQAEVGLPTGAPRIRPGMEVRLSSSNAVKRSLSFSQPNISAFRRRYPLKIAASLQKNNFEVQAEISGDFEPEVRIRSELAGPFDPARDSAAAAESIKSAFQRLGDTALSLEQFTLDNPDSLFVPSSRLNPFRREITARLCEAAAGVSEARIHRARKALDADSAGLQNSWGKSAVGEGRGGPSWILHVDDFSKIDAFNDEDLSGVDELQAEIPTDRDVIATQIGFLQRTGLSPDRIRWCLPSFCREYESEHLRRNIDALQKLGFKKFEASNLSSFSFMKNSDIVDLSAGWELYTLNHQSALALRELGVTRVTLSPEDSFVNWSDLAPALGRNCVAIIWQDTPLFISESCPHAAYLGRCSGPKNCSFKSMSLENGRGDKINIFSRRCRTFAVNSLPLNLSRDYRAIADLGIGWIRADFAISPYRPEDVKRIWLKLRSGQAVPGGFSANFRRGFLPLKEAESSSKSSFFFNQSRFRGC